MTTDETKLVSAVMAEIANLVRMGEPEWVARGLKKSFADRTETLLNRESVVDCALRIRAALDAFAIARRGSP